MTAPLSPGTMKRREDWGLLGLAAVREKGGAMKRRGDWRREDCEEEGGPEGCGAVAAVVGKKGRR